MPGLDEFVDEEVLAVELALVVEPALVMCVVTVVVVRLVDGELDVVLEVVGFTEVAVGLVVDPVDDFAVAVLVDGCAVLLLPPPPAEQPTRVAWMLTSSHQTVSTLPA